MINYISFAIENSLVITRLMYDHVIFLKVIIYYAGSNNNDNYEKHFDEVQDMYKDLLLDFLTLANGSVSAKFLREHILITEYTDILEKKTCLLSRKKTDPKINELSLSLKPKKSNKEYTKYEKETLKTLLKKLELILKKSIEKYELLNYEIDENIMEMFFDPNFINHFIDETKLFLYTLDFFVKQIKFTPSFVFCLNFEVAKILNEHSKYVYQMNNPVSDVFNEPIKKSSTESHDIMMESGTTMSPSSSKQISHECIDCTTDFIKWNEELLKRLVHMGYYQVIIPLLYDHILREANYFNYLLDTFDNEHLVYENLPF